MDGKAKTELEEGGGGGGGGGEEQEWLRRKLIQVGKRRGRAVESAPAPSASAGGRTFRRCPPSCGAAVAAAFIIQIRHQSGTRRKTRPFIIIFHKHLFIKYL